MSGPFHFAKPRTVWTAEKDAIIRARYPNEGPNASMCADLDATSDAIAGRAFRLGVKFAKPIKRKPAPGKPPKPRPETYVAMGIRSSHRLEPVSDEEQQAAIERFLAKRQPTICPPGWAHGADSFQTVGNERFRA